MARSELLDFILKVKNVIDGEETIVGTAFIVSDSYVVTAQHVIEKCNEGTLILETFDGKHTIKECSTYCSLRVDSKFIDIAIIKYTYSERIYNQLFPLLNDEVEVHNKYKTYGFPELEENQERYISGEVISPEGRLSIINSSGEHRGIALYRCVSGAPLIIDDKIKGIITDEFVTSKVTKPELFACKFNDIWDYLKSKQLNKNEKIIFDFLNKYCKKNKNIVLKNSDSLLDSIQMKDADCTNLYPIDVCIGLPEYKDKENRIIIERDAFIDEIKELLDNEVEVVFVDGDVGKGKTTVIEQFMKKYKENCFGIFYRNDFKFSNLESIKLDLSNQINIIVYSKLVNTESYNDILLQNNIQQLNAFSRRNNQIFYFLIDGLEEIEKNEEIIKNIIELLPIGCKNMRFIFSEDHNKVKNYLPNCDYKECSLLGFNIDETKKYLDELNLDEDTINKLWNSFRRNPGKLANIKRMILSGTKLEEILSLKNNEWEDLFEVEWKQIDKGDIIQQKLLFSLSINNKLNTLMHLSNIFKITLEEVTNRLINIPFIKISDNSVIFENDIFRRYVKKRLNKYKKELNETIAEYLLLNGDEDIALDLLPEYLILTNNFDELINYINVDNIIFMMKKTQTIYVAEKNINFGINASFNKNFYNDLLRLSIQKSTLLEYQNSDILHSQLNALVSLGEYKKAFNLVNSVIIKEERIHLLSIISRKMHQSKGYVDEIIIEEIKLLYNEVKNNLKNEKALKIASDLIFVLPNLAIELIEGRKNVASVEDKLDFAIAKLSLENLLNTDNDTTNEEVAVDRDDKIKRTTAKNLTHNIKLLVKEFTFEKLKIVLSNLNSASEKLFFLTKWISNRKEDSKIYEAIIYGLELMFNSTGYTPKVDVFKEMTSPLKYMNDVQQIIDIVSRIDRQLELLIDKGPTIEYVELVVNLCYGSMKINPQESQERILELYLFIEAIDDLNTKTVSMSLLFSNLKCLNHDGVIEKELGLDRELKSNLYSNIKEMFDTSANHYETCKDVIKNLAINYPGITYEIIKYINLEEYRDKALYELLITYIKNDIVNINIETIIKYLNLITRDILKYNFLLSLTERLSEEKIYLDRVIEIIKIFEVMVDNISDNLIRVHSYLNCYKIYNRINNTKKNFYLTKLQESASKIENNWIKIDFSYFLVSEVATYSIEDAKTIYQFIPNKEGDFLSFKTGQNLIYSIRLAIRAFSALVYKNNTEDFNKLKAFINIVPSLQEQIILWGELATRSYAYECKSFGDMIVNQEMYPRIEKLYEIDKEAYYTTIVRISCCLYLNCSTRACSEIELLPKYYKEYAFHSIVIYYCTKTYFSEPFDNDSSEKYDLTCNEVFELVNILGHISIDSIIYNIITDICNSTDNINANQRNDLTLKLENIVNEKLPDKNNIRHEGFKLVSQCQITKMKNNRVDVDNILKTLDIKVNNTADKSYILCILAGLIGSKDSIKITQLLKQAKAIIDSLPSNLERISHYEQFASMAKGKDQSLTQQALRDAMTIATKGNGKNYINAQRNIIDMAHKLDENLASSLLTLSDEDEVRKKYKKNIEQQSRINKLKKKMIEKNDENINVKDFREYSNAAWKNLASLNGKRINKMKIEDIIEYIKISSNIKMSYAFPIYSWIFENNIRRFMDTDLGDDIIKTMLNSALVGCELSIKLIAKSDSLMLKTSSQNNDSVKVNENERGKAIKYIINWCVENKPSKITIHDPNFSVEELYIIKEIYSVLQNCEFEIVTTFESANKFTDNDKTREEVFLYKWKELTDQEPPECLVWLLECEDKTPPINEFWILGDKSALTLNKSISRIGNEMIEITCIDMDDILRNYNQLNQFLERKIKTIEGKKIRKSSFNLV